MSNPWDAFAEAIARAPKLERVDPPEGGRVETLTSYMTERAKQYGAMHQRRPRDEISLLLDALDQAGLKMDDLTDDELAALDAEEQGLFDQYLPDDEEYDEQE